MEYVGVGAKAAVAHGHTPLVAQRGSGQAVMDAVNDKAGKAQALRLVP